MNEQTLVSLLLAGPGVIATIIFAPLIITLFYSPEFYEAVEVLRWICLGVAMRVHHLAHGIHHRCEKSESVIHNN